MPFVYPTSPSFREMTMRMEDPSVSFRSQNGRRAVRKVSGHLWSGTFVYPPMTKAQFTPIRGFLAKLRGVYNTFTIVPPHLANPVGTQLTDTTVNVAAAIGATSVVVGNTAVGRTFIAGDVLKFSNQDKVYILTDDTTSTGTTATIKFAPPLITAVTTAHTVKHKDVPFTCALSNSVQEMKTDLMDLYYFEIDIEEVF